MKALMDDSRDEAGWADGDFVTLIKPKPTFRQPVEVPFNRIIEKSVSYFAEHDASPFGNPGKGHNGEWPHPQAFRKFLGV